MSIKVFVNRFLHLFEVMRVKTQERVVYLTFDDGPEDGIVDFILDQLNKYNFKATFFCKGENAKIYPALMQKIVDDGHAVGNHTYSHINGFNTPKQVYVEDVEKADKFLHTHLFRPPWGCITLNQFIQLRKKYKIVYWSLISGDTTMDKLELESNMQRLYNKTKSGDIVLFHSCIRHENETKRILPLYLEWLKQNGYKSNVLK